MKEHTRIMYLNDRYETYRNLVLLTISLTLKKNSSVEDFKALLNNKILT